MRRPEPMVRALIVGPRDKLPATIETLHDMRLLHIVDHPPGDPEFPIGSPLPDAASNSESLIKLRSISAILQVSGTEPSEEAVEFASLRDKIGTLELNINEEAAAKKEADRLLADLRRRIEELRPFASLGLNLGTLRGYESLAVLVGRMPHAGDQIRAKLPSSELFVAGDLVALFVRRNDVENARSFLSSLGFIPLTIPEGDGDPRSLLAASEADRDKWDARREQIEERLSKLRERYGAFVLAAQDALEVEVEKAEAPLRFAVSDHSFVIDGWVPRSRAAVLATRLDSSGIHAEFSAPAEKHAEAEPPVLLRNSRPARPFEFLIHLYSTPSYRELNPTLFLVTAFPFFFGFMVGDIGYGALFFAIGLIALAKLPRTSDFRNLLVVIAFGGFWAIIFGAFFFGEMFGIPFHLAEGHTCEDEIAWVCFGLDYPLGPVLHKLIDIGDIMYLSIVFAMIHLGASLLMGFANEVRHSRKHALAKVGLLLSLFGIFTLITSALATRPFPPPFAEWTWNVALGWFPRAELTAVSDFLGLEVPAASVVLLFGVLLAFGETPVAPLELGTLLANMMSYTRLGAIAIGKAAIAGALNGIILTALVIGQPLGTAIFGYALLVIAQFLIFLVGGLSAGIQGIRLNYVESFIKFYKGNGTRFFPFGARSPQEA